MARHRSPRGRRPHQPQPFAVSTRATDGGGGAHRSVSAPLRRGATAVAVTGGALTLVGAAVPTVAQAGDSVDAPALAAYTALPVAAAEPAPADALMLPSIEPVAPAPMVGATDGAALVKAAGLYEQEIARVAAEQAAAQQRAAEEQAAAAARTPDPDDEESDESGGYDGSGDSGASGSPGCDMDTGGLGAVKSHVRDAAEFLGCQYGEPAMHGVAGRAGTSDHPGGLAVDFMVDRSTGDRLAQCALDNQDALGIKYVIWEQAINHGSGWDPMEDRGGATANHFDHVHISFDSGRGSGDLGSC